MPSKKYYDIYKQDPEYIEKKKQKDKEYYSRDARPAFNDSIPID